MSDQMLLGDQLKNMFQDLGFDSSILPSILLTDIKEMDNQQGEGSKQVNASFQLGNCKGYYQSVGIPVDGKMEFKALAYTNFDSPIDVGASLPLVGDKIPSDILTWTGAWLSITSENPKSVTLPVAGTTPIPTGVYLGLSIKLWGGLTNAMLPLKQYTSDPPKSNFSQRADETPATSDTPDGTIPVQKTAGPLTVNHLAIHFTKPVLTCTVDAALKIGPFQAAMKGLGMGITIDSNHASDPQFELSGLGFSYVGPTLKIGGMAEKLPASLLPAGTASEYDGALAVQFNNIGLAALASYAGLNNGDASFFIFTDLAVPIGGPPFFDVTGLTGGFGWDRYLTMPSLDVISQFPLLTLTPSGKDPKANAVNAVETMDGQKAGTNGKKVNWVIPKTNDYWLAAGIQFTSFQIIQGQILLAAQFGQDLTFALLGLAKISVPHTAFKDQETKGPIANITFVYAELQMGAILAPDTGSFYVGASLTKNSFLMAKAVHLTGGFAVALWFGKNPMHGQFVFSMGGYHPAFSIPSSYPNVPRLSFNWSASNEVSLKGACYLAVTSSCMMAGGGLEISYQDWIVKAWFTAQADFLVNWHPFSFMASISIELGASVTVKGPFGIQATVKTSIGATLSLWGPPLGGYVRVHVVIVTIKIYFGSSISDFENHTRIPLQWSDFAPMLPPVNERCSFSATAGLSNLTTDRDKWVVRSGTFQFAAYSAIPLSSMTNAVLPPGSLLDAQNNRLNTQNNSLNTQKPPLNAQDSTLDTDTSIQIRPMNQSNVYSQLSLRIVNMDTNQDVDYSNWTFNEIRTDIAAALWGPPLTDDQGAFTQTPTVPSSEMISQALTGFSVIPPLAELPDSFGNIIMTNLTPELIDYENPQNPLQPGSHICSDYNSPSVYGHTLDDLNQINSWSDNRTALYQLLNNSGLYNGDHDDMRTMAAKAYTLFSDSPLEQS